MSAAFEDLLSVVSTENRGAREAGLHRWWARWVTEVAGRCDVDLRLKRLVERGAPDVEIMEGERRAMREAIGQFIAHEEGVVHELDVGEVRSETGRGRPKVSRTLLQVVMIRAKPLALVLLLLGAGGCAALREAFTDDRSAWSPAMLQDADECDKEVVEGRWGWHRPRPDGWTVGFGEARIACLRDRDWKLGAGGRLGP